MIYLPFHVFSVRNLTESPLSMQHGPCSSTASLPKICLSCFVLFLLMLIYLTPTLATVDDPHDDDDKDDDKITTIPS